MKKIEKIVKIMNKELGFDFTSTILDEYRFASRIENKLVCFIDGHDLRSVYIHIDGIGRFLNFFGKHTDVCVSELENAVIQLSDEHSLQQINMNALGNALNLTKMNSREFEMRNGLKVVLNGRFIEVKNATPNPFDQVLYTEYFIDPTRNKFESILQTLRNFSEMEAYYAN